jgi:hypothetical protein
MLVLEPDEVTLAVSVGVADGSAVEVGVDPSGNVRAVVGVLSSATMDAVPEPMPVPEPESDEL